MVSIMKAKRQQMIDKIILENEIDTQELLLEQLKLAGIDVTQATVSRDIKEMELIKISINNKSVYSRTHKLEVIDRKSYPIFLEAVLSVDYAQNIVCVKCRTGTGSAACATIDSMNIGEIVGTIAGDDTIFILLKTTHEAVEFVDRLNEFLSK